MDQQKAPQGRRGRRSDQLVLFEHGKIPPQALEMEEAVLGIIMTYGENSLVQGLFVDFRPEVFYKESHQVIAQAILELHKDNVFIDILVVTDKLRSMGVLEIAGGPYYITLLTNKVSSAANIGYDYAIIFQKWMQREIIRVSSEVAKNCYEDTIDVFKLLDDFIDQLEECNPKKNNTGSLKAFDIVDELDKSMFSEDLNDSLFGSRNTRWKRFNEVVTISRDKLILVAGGAKHAKCFTKGTEFISSDGSLVKVEDLKIDDLLMGADNTIKKVTHVNSGTQMMYDIIQSNGITYRVNEDHVLSVKTSFCGGKNDKLKWKDDYVGKIHHLTVKEFLSKSNTWKRYHKGYKQFIEWDHKDIKIDPYFLGLWLGDGNRCDSGISSMDHEVVAFLIDYANNLGLSLSSYDVDRCPIYHIIDIHRKRGMKNILKENGMLFNKHIPTEYMINSSSIRYQILAGLIDSDGSKEISFNNCVERYAISQKDEKLANEIAFLCDSLGFITTVTKKKSILNGVLKGYHYLISIKGNCCNIPCRVERKIISRKHTKEVTLSTLTIVPYKIDTYYGLTLDSNDERFLLKDFTVVHNTKFVSKIIFDLCEDHKDTAVFWCTFEDSKYDILRSYLASKVIVKPKYIKLKKFPLNIGIEIRKAMQKFKTFDITFRDQPLKSKEVVHQFRKFCDLRPGKFCILVFDNIMSAADRDDYPRDLNAMYDNIMANLSNARQWTKQCVIVLHHYNDAQQEVDGLSKAFRPRLKDIKGTEAFRRVPTQVLMVNYFKKYKDLVAEYTGDHAELVKYMYVVDAAANREDDDADEVGLIHYFVNADFTLFSEIEYPEIKKKNNTFTNDKPQIDTPI